MEAIYASMHQAKTNLSKLVAAAEAGQQVFITRRGHIAASLLPPQPVITSAIQTRPFGTLKGKINMRDDFFDRLLPEENAIFDDPAFPV